MNRESNLISLSPAFLNSAFKPMQTKQWSITKNIPSIITPLLEKSPLMFQNQNDLRLHNNFLENSIITIKNDKSSFPTKATTRSNNPMNIQFESFSSPERNIKEMNFNPPSFSIGQSFFQIQTPQKQGILHNEINTFLYKRTSEKKKIKENDMYSEGPPFKGGFMKKISFDQIKANGNIKVNCVNYTTTTSPNENEHTLFRSDIITKNKNKKVTNVINNFYIQLHGNKTSNNNVYSHNKTITGKESEGCCSKGLKLVGKKRGRKSIRCSLTKQRKIKKIDKTTLILNFNQIKIKNVSLIKYPLISLPNEELTVEIYARLLTEENYFKCEDRNTSNQLIIPTNELSNKEFISYFLDKLYSNENIFYLEENQNIKQPYEIIRNYYNKIKKTIITIQKNFIGKRKGILNKEQCDILYNLIKTLNFISEIICSFHSFNIYDHQQLNDEYIINNQNCFNDLMISPVSDSDKQSLKKLYNTKQKVCSAKKIQNSKEQEVYICPFCLKTFDKGQKLGGHMSRNHPNQSEKYKEKMTIRNRRTNNRKLLAVIKDKFFKQYNKDIKVLDKREIQIFLKAHKIEYIHFKKQEQKKYKFNTQEKEESDSEEYFKHSQFQSQVHNDKNLTIDYNTNIREVNFQIKRPLFKNSTSIE
jgi:hypothetical protein